MNEPWWNTSEGLLRLAPEMEKASGWKAFAGGYDNEDARDERLRRWREANPRQSAPDPSAEQLEDLARIACGKVNPRLLFLPDTHKLSGLRQAAAGEKLAAIVVQLLIQKPPENLRKLVETLEARQKLPPPSRNVADVITALLSFVGRERRLPGKKELNIEANRLAKAQSFRTKGKVSGLDWGADFFDGPKIEGSKRNRFVVIESFHEVVRACPWEEWNSPRWQPPDSTETWKSAGLGALPRVANPKL